MHCQRVYSSGLSHSYEKTAHYHSLIREAKVILPIRFAVVASEPENISHVPPGTIQIVHCHEQAPFRFVSAGSTFLNFLHCHTDTGHYDRAVFLPPSREQAGMMPLTFSPTTSAGKAPVPQAE